MPSCGFPSYDWGHDSCFHPLAQASCASGVILQGSNQQRIVGCDFLNRSLPRHHALSHRRPDGTARMCSAHRQSCTGSCSGSSHGRAAPSVLPADLVLLRCTLIAGRSACFAEVVRQGVVGLSMGCHVQEVVQGASSCLRSLEWTLPGARSLSGGQSPARAQISRRPCQSARLPRASLWAASAFARSRVWQRS